jgi:pimeloyl-ACP methyl ester carboxylesterase
MDDHVEDLEQVRRSVGFERFSIMGSAIGGVISMFYAHRYPERVDFVIFTNPTMGANPKTNTERAEKVMAEDMQSIAEAAVSRAFGELPHDARYVYFRDEMFSKINPLGYQRALMGLIQKDIKGIAAEIRCPVLLLGGRLDIVNPPSVVDEIAAMLPDARIDWVERAAHFAPYQAPEACAEAAKAFLNR